MTLKRLTLNKETLLRITGGGYSPMIPTSVDTCKNEGCTIGCSDACPTATCATKCHQNSCQFPCAVISAAVVCSVQP